MKHRTNKEKLEIVTEIKSLTTGPKRIGLAKACKKLGVSFNSYLKWNKPVAMKKSAAVIYKSGKVIPALEQTHIGSGDEIQIAFQYPKCFVVVTNTGDLPSVLRSLA